MCYHAEFSRSSLKRVVIDRGEPPPPNWEALGLCPFGKGPWLTPLKQTPSPCVCYHVKFGVSQL